MIMLINKARLYDETKATAQSKKAKAKVTKKTKKTKVLSSKKSPPTKTQIKKANAEKARRNFEIIRSTAVVWMT